MAAVESARRLCAYPGCTEPRGKRSDALTCSEKHKKALQRLRLPDETEIDDAIAKTDFAEDALLAVVIRRKWAGMAVAA
jgi:hypothetical protein